MDNHSKAGARHPDRLTYPAEEHALPLRTIFEEYRMRRRSDIEAAIREHVVQAEAELRDESEGDLLSEAGGDVWTVLDWYLARSEEAYAALAAMKDVVEWIEQQSEESYEQFRDRVRLGYEKIWKAEFDCQRIDAPLKRVLHDMDATAVCLSGGGIRSASFSLGVLQGLARFSRPRKSPQDPAPSPEGSVAPHRLLDCLDYLSTVSGGGYIGSWLMAWAQRSSYRHVVHQLAASRHTSGDPEPQPIRHLREYTSYLSPRLGFTLDTLTLLTIVVRNMALNWLIIVPVVICLFCLPPLLWAFSYGWPLWSPQQWTYWSPHVMWWATACIGLAAVFVAIRNWQPAYSTDVKNARNRGSAFREFWLFALPMTFGGWLMSETWLRRGLTDPRHYRSLHEITGRYLLFVLAPPLLMSLVRLKVLTCEEAPSKHSMRPHVTWLERIWPGFASFLDDIQRRRLITIEDIGDNKQRPTVFHVYREPRNREPRKPGISGWQFSWSRVIWSFIGPVMMCLLIALLLAKIDIVVASWIAVPDLLAAHVPQSGHFVRPLFAAYAGYQELDIRIFCTFAVPLILLVMMLAGTCLSGLLSNIEREQELEWWARGGALLLFVVLGWIGLNGIAYFAPNISHSVLIYVLAAMGFGAGSIGSLAGLSAVTASGLKRVKVEQLSKSRQWLSRHGALASVACGISLVCIALTLASFTIWLRGRVEAWLLPGAVTELQKLRNDILATLIVFGAAAIVALFANLFINVNRFSLHGLYSMRLTRAFLGASNVNRCPDPFTNFDDRDDMDLGEMPCSPPLDLADTPARASAPIHVINAALNVLATRNLAWQQRKAESFTFSPVSCGSWRLGYVPTREYGGSRGVSLGTAMAISGAAFNPNMGHHSSPLVTFLMTFFDARLGWWLPNPLWPALKRQELRRRILRKFTPRLEVLQKIEKGLEDELSITADSRYLPRQVKQAVDMEAKRIERKFLRKSDPELALMPLINEALGNTDDRYAWIQLSDGGHFENLGLYEMVLRRCRNIVVVDCDADTDYHFEDLGNALRKIKIDLGVSIRLDPHAIQLLKPKDPDQPSKIYCFEGTIAYSEADRDPFDQTRDPEKKIRDGKLVYIKPTLTGSEPADVCAYQSVHPEFPHESTTNQFFNEAQFESYRALGDWVMRTITREDYAHADYGCDMEGFMQAVRSHCQNQAASPVSTRATAAGE